MADAAAAAAAAAAANFALSPARVSHDVIDYASKAGSSIWRSATQPLSEDLFDCTPEGLRDFLQLMGQRGNLMGWDSSVLFIPDDIANPVGVGKDFTRNYGNITIEHLMTVATAYANAQARVAQDSIQLATCAMASLSKVGRDKITLHEKEYSVGGLGGVIAGILMIKVIVRKSHIDTNATVATIRDSLIELPTYMVKDQDFLDYIRRKADASRAKQIPNLGRQGDMESSF
jgi:hypothetical protein